MTAVQPRPRPNPVRTLIVDDNPLTAQLLQDFLELRADFQVIGTASNGQQALTQAARLNPDLVLMDVELSGMNGLETTRQLKAAQPKLYVIVVSVYDPQEIHAAVRASGAEALVAKSRLVHELVPAVKRLWPDSPDPALPPA